MATAAATAPLLVDEDGRAIVCLPLPWQESYYWVLRVPPRWVDFYLRVGAHLPEEGWYVDADGDGFGAGAEVISCVISEELAPNGDDCNDFLASVSPEAEESCQGLDDDCDGMVDEGCEGAPEGGHEPGGTCLCGWPELHCTVGGETGPLCANASDCDGWCTGGLPTCAAGAGELPPECEGESGCFFVEESCGPQEPDPDPEPQPDPEPTGVCLCGWPELSCLDSEGLPGPACDTGADCEAWCRGDGGGLPTCALGPGLFPPECAGDQGCFFIEEECAER